MGKTTALKDIKSLFGSGLHIYSPSSIDWDVSKGITSNFGSSDPTLTSQQIYNRATDILQSIGLNSVPTWVKPYPVLSQGEKYRATFARLLEIALFSEKAKANDDYIIALDEFTSVLDRITARCMSASINKYVRRKKKISRFILVSANTDIIRYLQPSLVISLGGNGEGMKMFINHNKDKKQNVKSVIDVDVLKAPKLGEMQCLGSYKNRGEFCIPSLLFFNSLCLHFVSHSPRQGTVLSSRNGSNRQKNISSLRLCL